MNDLDVRVAAAAAGDASAMAGLQFGYMDGYPSDFPARTADHWQVLAAVFGVERSLTLRKHNDTTPIIDGLALKPWKQTDDAYKDAFADGIANWRVREPLKVYVLAFNPRRLFELERAVWANHFEVGQPRPNIQEYADANGRQMVRTLRCYDGRNPEDPERPICMARDSFTVMLLWAEFIIHVYEEVARSVHSIGEQLKGLVMFSDLISGDSLGNGDNRAQVVRALVNDAHSDRITFRNYSVQDQHVGEVLADNLVGCVGRKLRTTNKPFLGEPERGCEFSYLVIDAWANLVPWPHRRR